MLCIQLSSHTIDRWKRWGCWCLCLSNMGWKWMRLGRWLDPLRISLLSFGQCLRIALIRNEPERMHGLNFMCLLQMQCFLRTKCISRDACKCEGWWEQLFLAWSDTILIWLCLKLQVWHSDNSSQEFTWCSRWRYSRWALPMCHQLIFLDYIYCILLDFIGFLYFIVL